jgi:hypothetical protein
MRFRPRWVWGRVRVESSRLTQSNNHYKQQGACAKLAAFTQSRWLPETWNEFPLKAHWSQKYQRCYCLACFISDGKLHETLRDAMRVAPAASVDSTFNVTPVVTAHIGSEDAPLKEAKAFIADHMRN